LRVIKKTKKKAEADARENAAKVLFQGKGNNMKGFKRFYLNARARTWP